MPRERELQRWDAGADSAMDLSLDDSGSAGWDQFAANEAMYGVSTTYDENIYTTQIDRSDPQYNQLEAKAARIAREIEGSAPSNAHVAEERQQNAQRGDGGLDEEDKYSGVKRDASALPRRAAGAYVPPSQRPITNSPTVPGAPFDPAIISSSLAKSTITAARTLDLPNFVDAGASDRLKTPPTEAVSKDVLSAGPATAQPTPAKKTEITTEDHVKNAADSFKHFANTEKLRVRAVQEQKRSQQRAEKNVKLNDLKKFAANFKLNSRIPDDLVPILAKDHNKQKEIQQKAEEAAKEDEKKAKEREFEKASVGAASPAPSASSSIAGPVSAAAQLGKSDSSHVPFSHHPRAARMSGNTRQPMPIPAPQTQSPRQNAGGASNRAYANIPGFPRPQPLPADLRIPTGPTQTLAPADIGPLSPGAATRLNAGAKTFEFRPAAHSFTPTTPSPARHEPETADFFAKGKSANAKEVEEDNLDDAFSAVKQSLRDTPEEQKSQLTSTGGIPQPYRTHPSWTSEGDERTLTPFVSFIPKAPTPSSTHSQVHTPNPNSGHMPQLQQLPPHMQGQPMGTPSSRPAYMPPHHMPPNIPPHHHNHFGPGHFPGTNGSVQSSPRFSGAQVAFNGQIPQNMGMPQFAGQQFNGQQMGPMGMQGYGMSPGMSPGVAHRQLQVQGMPHGAGGGMMMMPGGQGQYGQSKTQNYVQCKAAQ